MNVLIEAALRSIPVLALAWIAAALRGLRGRAGLDMADRTDCIRAFSHSRPGAGAGSHFHHATGGCGGFGRRGA